MHAAFRPRRQHPEISSPEKAVVEMVHAEARGRRLAAMESAAVHGQVYYPPRRSRGERKSVRDHAPVREAAIDLSLKNVSRYEGGLGVSQGRNEVSGSEGHKTKRLEPGACRSAAAPKRNRRRRRERVRERSNARLGPRLLPGARRLHFGEGETNEGRRFQAFDRLRRCAWDRGRHPEDDRGCGECRPRHRREDRRSRHHPRTLGPFVRFQSGRQFVQETLGRLGLGRMDGRPQR